MSDCTQQELGCNQLCPECEVIGRAEVVNQDQIYDYGIYAAIYAVAHALHDTLDCSHGHCSSNITVEPYMVTKWLTPLIFFYSFILVYSEESLYLQDVLIYVYLFLSVYLPQITAALKKVKFQLYNQTIQFDQNGNPPALYSIVYWNWTTCNPDIIGSYNVKQNPSFQIDENLITWFDGSNKVTNSALTAVSFLESIQFNINIIYQTIK